MALGYKGIDFCLQRYVDSDWAGDMDGRSTIGYIFTLGSATVSCVKATEDSYFVHDRGQICCNDRGVQGADIAEEFYGRT